MARSLPRIRQVGSDADIKESVRGCASVTDRLIDGIAAMKKIDKLDSGANLTNLINKVNEVIDTLNTLRSKA